MPSITITELAAQFSTPSDVSSVLMIIGGDVVQKALAQTTGCWYTPVCFSFGWVGYAFMILINIIGDGRLLPPPDYPVKVFDKWYSRDSKNWLIGRILRDNEAYTSRRYPESKHSLRITVWEAQNPHNQVRFFSYTNLHMLGLATTLFQLVIASFPIILHGQWGVLFITGVGTILALLAGCLPQWMVEKQPYRHNYSAIIALTTGNGSREVMVIKGNGHAMNLMDFCTEESPRNQRPWRKLKRGSNKEPDPNPPRLARILWGFPLGYWLTICVCVVQSFLWLFLLITSAALTTDTWFLIFVGVVGMFQNAYVASRERDPKHRDLPLKLIDTITGRKVMDALMDFEYKYGCGRALRNEYFPGELRPDEASWWNGDYEAYDRARMADTASGRGIPLSFKPGAGDTPISEKLVIST